MLSFLIFLSFSKGEEDFLGLCFFLDAENESMCPEKAEKNLVSIKKENFTLKNSPLLKITLLTNQEIYPSLYFENITKIEVFGLEKNVSFISINSESQINSLSVSKCTLLSEGKITTSDFFSNLSEIKANVICFKTVSTDLDTIRNTKNNIMDGLTNSVTKLTINVTKECVRVIFTVGLYYFETLDSKKTSVKIRKDLLNIDIFVPEKEIIFEMLHFATGKVRNDQKLATLPNIMFFNQNKNATCKAVIFDTSCSGVSKNLLNIADEGVLIYSDLDNDILPGFFNQTGHKVIPRKSGKYCLAEIGKTELCEEDEFVLYVDSGFYKVGKFALRPNTEYNLDVSVCSFNKDNEIYTAQSPFCNMRFHSNIYEGEQNMITLVTDLWTQSVTVENLRFKSKEIIVDSFTAISSERIAGTVTISKVCTFTDSDTFIPVCNYQENAKLFIIGLYPKLYLYKNVFDIRDGNNRIYIPLFAEKISVTIKTLSKNVIIYPCDDNFDSGLFKLELIFSNNSNIYLTENWDREIQMIGEKFILSIDEDCKAFCNYEGFFFPSSVWEIKPGIQLKTKDIDTYCLYSSTDMRTSCRRTDGKPLEYKQNIKVRIMPITKIVTLIVYQDRLDIYPVIESSHFNNIEKLNIFYASKIEFINDLTTRIDKVYITHSNVFFLSKFEINTLDINYNSVVKGSYSANELQLYIGTYSTYRKQFEKKSPKLYGMGTIEIKKDKCILNKNIEIDSKGLELLAVYDLNISLLEAAETFPSIKATENVTIFFEKSCYMSLMKETKGKLVITCEGPQLTIRGDAKREPKFAIIPKESENVKYDFFGVYDPSLDNDYIPAKITIIITGVVIVILSIILFAFCVTGGNIHKYKKRCEDSNNTELTSQLTQSI